VTLYKRLGRRITIGRLSIYFEPRDVWAGVFVAPAAVYVCPIPCLVLRWARNQPAPVDDAAAYQELLRSIWLYVGWRYVTRQLTTDQKELWAAALEAEDDPDLQTTADRWWLA
jgi:hypothetical protein